MSTSILTAGENGATLYLTEFYGGPKRGTCYQITTPDGAWVTLKRSQIFELVRAFINRELDCLYKDDRSA